MGDERATGVDVWPSSRYTGRASNEEHHAQKRRSDVHGCATAITVMDAGSRERAPMTNSAEEALPLGTEVRGRYRTLTTVGRGGVGTVYKVADVLYGNTYALKELADPSDSARKQFENEALWLQGLNHINIPKVREFFEWERR